MDAFRLADEIVGMDRPNATDVEIVFVNSDNTMPSRRRFTDGNAAADYVLSDEMNHSRRHVAEVYATREQRHVYACRMLGRAS